MKISKCTFPIISNRISAPKLISQRQSSPSNVQYQTPTPENLRANYLIGFSGAVGIEKCKKVTGQKVNHRTHFFREPKTDKIVQEYIREKFANDSEVRIVSGACSTGEEAKSYFMMLDDEFGKKLHVSGFDISRQSINDASKPVVQIFIGEQDGKNGYKAGGQYCREAFLIRENDNGLDDYKKKCREKFNEYYEKYGEPTPVESDEPKTTFLAQNFVPKKGKSVKCKFEKRGVEQLKGLFRQNTVNVLLYRNAIHYSLCEKPNGHRRRMMLDAAPKMNDIARKMNWAVKMNGLVVFEEAPQKGLDYDLVERCMRNNGFKKLVRNEKEIKNVWVKTQDVEETIQAQKSGEISA